MAPDRRILHVDMDAFFASVEQHDNPSLRGLPIVVGGSEQARGVVSAASYEARVYGIKSAMPMSRAMRLCPHVVRVPARHARYREVSREIHCVFEEFTPHVEPLSLDESYLDVTEICLRDRVPLADVASAVKQAIKARTGLTASAGGGPNKLIAKIASDVRKPDGLLVVRPGEVRSFLRPLPVERLWGVGPVMAARLHDLGLRRVGEVADRDLAWLERQLGKSGAELHAQANGVDDRPVFYDPEPRSISSETTFAVDLRAPEDVLSAIREQSDEVAERLQRHGYEARTVTLKVRWQDFTTITRSASPAQRVTQTHDIVEIASRLLSRTEFPRRAVRLVGVGVSGLAPQPRVMQLELPF